MPKIYTSADQIIGNTPLLELTNIEKHFNLNAKIIAKLEYLNPAGSAKDRVAKQILDDYEAEGKINKSTTIIEPTSGNTGIGLASVAAARGYKIIIVMPDNMSVERQQIIAAYGAKLVLTDGKLGMQGAIDKAEELNKTISNSIIAGQFTNPSNSKAHFLSTGPEIFNDTDGNIDYFVAGVGTGGTITGIGEYLKSKIKDVKIIAVEPETSPFLSKGQGGAHQIQGIGAGFIPEILNTSVYDQIITVPNQEAFDFGNLIGKKEGILVGISSGAALYAAVEIAKKEENKGKNIVVLLPDTGDRYLSTNMFK